MIVGGLGDVTHGYASWVGGGADNQKKREEATTDGRMRGGGGEAIRKIVGNIYLNRRLETV